MRYTASISQQAVLIPMLGLQVRVTVQYHHSLDIVLVVQAHALGDLEYNRMQCWVPNAGLLPKQCELENASVQRHLKVSHRHCSSRTAAIEAVCTGGEGGSGEGGKAGTRGNKVGRGDMRKRG